MVWENSFPHYGTQGTKMLSADLYTLLRPKDYYLVLLLWDQISGMSLQGEIRPGVTITRRHLLRLSIGQDP